MMKEKDFALALALKFTNQMAVLITWKTLFQVNFQNEKHNWIWSSQ